MKDEKKRLQNRRLFFALPIQLVNRLSNLKLLCAARFNCKRSTNWHNYWCFLYDCVYSARLFFSFLRLLLLLVSIAFHHSRLVEDFSSRTKKGLKVFRSKFNLHTENNLQLWTIMKKGGDSRERMKERSRKTKMNCRAYTFIFWFGSVCIAYIYTSHGNEIALPPENYCWNFGLNLTLIS